MKKIIFIIFSIVTVLLAISSLIEFIKILSNFSINSKIELMFILGFILYFIFHFLLYKPVFIPIMTHELTHLLWTYIFGGRAKKLEVGRNGGSVLINKSNFIISLAPYFFPLYTFIFIIIYIISEKKYLPIIAFFIGVSLSFHIALTLFTMQRDQSDFTQNSNIVFSISFIFLMNIIVIVFVLSILNSKINFLNFVINIFKRSINITMDIVKFINDIIIK